MKKKFISRIATVVAAVAIGVGATCMFAGCTSDHPEATITYRFRGTDYAVTYTLSRQSTPETTQHFIELADSGFYDGTVIHSYDANFLYGGTYTIEDGMLAEKDYFSFVKAYEKDHDPFTQTVFKTDEARTPLYTVVGEFSDNNRTASGSDYRHTKGALAMYYPKIDVKSFRYSVSVERADGGENNDGDPYDVKEYRYNSATSGFYTFLGESRPDLNNSYAVFGMVKDFSGEMQSLLNAISDYSSTLDENESFTTACEDFPETLYLFNLVQGTDPDFENLRRSGIEATDYNAPLKEPITVVSVKIDKY